MVVNTVLSGQIPESLRAEYEEAIDLQYAMFSKKLDTLRSAARDHTTVKHDLLAAVLHQTRVLESIANDLGDLKMSVENKLPVGALLLFLTWLFFFFYTCSSFTV
jgi:hypothetical protein